MQPETPRLPYPITWEEQDRLFPKLPARLGRMALFAVNTGLRENNVCGLELAGEVAVPEVGRSVFVIPPKAFKSKRAQVVILNDIAADGGPESPGSTFFSPGLTAVLHVRVMCRHSRAVA